MSSGTPGPYHVFHRQSSGLRPALYICTDPSSATRALLTEVAVIYPSDARYQDAVADAANISQLPAMLKLVTELAENHSVLRDLGERARDILLAIKATREA